MKAKIVPISNLKSLAVAFEGLKDRAPGQPKIVVVHGATGLGKSTGVASLAVQHSAVLITALPFWTTHAMLGRLTAELGGAPLRRSADMFDFITAELTARPRPIVIDEGDNAIERKEQSETLRILHDLARVPLILVGMTEFRRKLAHRPQFASRLAAEIEFKPLTRNDTQMLAQELVEIRLSDDLIDALHARAGGSARRLVDEFARAESFARRRGLARLTLEIYSGKPAARSEMARAA